LTGVDASAVGGERFVEGTAMVCYFAEERYKGKDRAQMIAHEGSTAS
jgi:hypothetical protein